MLKKAWKQIICIVLAVAMIASLCFAVSASSVKFNPSRNGFSINIITASGNALLPGVRTTVGETGEVIYGSDEFSWPVPGYYKLSSLFGNRIHPITGKPNDHTGIDIPVPYNTPIQAALDGEVIVSGWDNSYGNYVKLKHASGKCTLYAHMATRACSVGDYVTTGQVIGYADSTGSSTGNHLHFEIHSDIYWNREDPVNYFSGLGLYVESGGQISYL